MTADEAHELSTNAPLGMLYAAIRGAAGAGYTYMITHKSNLTRPYVWGKLLADGYELSTTDDHGMVTISWG